MTGYVRKFECNAMMSFKISNKQFLKKYNQIWKKVEKLLKIEFNSELVYVDNDKYIKTKIKIYNSSIITNFQNKKMPKEKTPCKCLSIIMLDSVIKAKKKYYPQEKIKLENLIDDDLEKNSSDESDSESDNDLIMINLMNNLLKAKLVF